MAKKGASKRIPKREAPQVIEDLDLDVDDLDTTNRADEDILHDRRSSRKDRSALSNLSAVLPSDAHRLDGYGEDEYGFKEEEELAVSTERLLRNKATEEDFSVSGLPLGTPRTGERKRAISKKASLDVAPAIEAVERDFAGLSSSERLEVLQRESPELLKMLEDLKRYLVEVKELAKPLHELLYERKVPEADKNLVSFLETKVQLMLSYCMHVTFYLLLKAEGKKVAGHPVVDNLVEIRVYLEKMWPLEEKLQYSLNRLLAGKPSATAHLDDLRPVRTTGGDTYEVARNLKNTKAGERRKQLREMQEAEELEREEQATMTRVRTKTGSRLNAVNTNVAIAPLSYQEDEDQYFSKMTGGEDGVEEEGLSLMDRLRRQQRARAMLSTAEDAEEFHGAGEGREEEGEEMDLVSDGEDEGELMDATASEGGESVDYDALVQEEAERKRAKIERDAVPREKLAPEEVDRRKAGKRIESHRGLTKARPKDRKTPRVAQRRKYERGMRVQKALSRTYQPEAEGGFVGVPSLRPGVVRGLKLQ